MKQSIYFEDYSENSFVIYGETKPYKDEIKNLGGKWNSNLKTGPGWIFSNKNKCTAHEWFVNKVNEIKAKNSDDLSETEIKENQDLEKHELVLDNIDSKKHDLVIQIYSDKSFVVRGNDTKIFKDKLKEFGGKWNSNLKDGGGWIFSNKNKNIVEDWFNTL
jgi:hypothetical protein